MNAGKLVTFKIAIAVTFILQTSLCLGQFGGTGGPLIEDSVWSTSQSWDIQSWGRSISLYFDAQPEFKKHKCICILTSTPASSVSLIVELEGDDRKLGDFELFASPSGCLAKVSISTPLQADFFVQNKKGAKTNAVLKIDQSSYEMENGKVYLLNSSGLSVLEFKTENSESPTNADVEKLKAFFAAKLAELEKGNCERKGLNKGEWVSQEFIDLMMENEQRRKQFWLEFETEGDGDQNEDGTIDGLCNGVREG